MSSLLMVHHIIPWKWSSTLQYINLTDVHLFQRCTASGWSICWDAIIAGNALQYLTKFYWFIKRSVFGIVVRESTGCNKAWMGNASGRRNGSESDCATKNRHKSITVGGMFRFIYKSCSHINYEEPSLVEYHRTKGYWNMSCISGLCGHNSAWQTVFAS